MSPLLSVASGSTAGLPLSLLLHSLRRRSSSFFFFNDTATTEIYTLSLHDALPISGCPPSPGSTPGRPRLRLARLRARDRKSTRLNSSHVEISYAVFCLKKKKLITSRSRTWTSATKIIWLETPQIKTLWYRVH